MDIVNATVVYVVLLMIAIFSMAWVGYFVGMVITLTTGSILGVAPSTITAVFSWIGIGSVILTTIGIMSNNIKVVKEYDEE